MTAIIKKLGEDAKVINNVYAVITNVDKTIIWYKQTNIGTDVVRLNEEVPRDSYHDVDIIE
ncbi:MAG: hypothetical protein MJ126_09895 [Lachnospiraceae bacterium]|nr:hypothetical protein [Lachnospiraceae bacterium]